MGLIENHHMIFEKIGICYTLPHKNSIGYVSQSCFRACFIIKTNCIADLPSHSGCSFSADSVGHADSCHSSGLSDDDIDVFDGFDFPFGIFFNFFLITKNIRPDFGRIHHILRKLR